MGTQSNKDVYKAFEWVADQMRESPIPEITEAEKTTPASRTLPEMVEVKKSRSQFISD